MHATMLARRPNKRICTLDYLVATSSTAVNAMYIYVQRYTVQYCIHNTGILLYSTCVRRSIAPQSEHTTALHGRMYPMSLIEPLLHSRCTPGGTVRFISVYQFYCVPQTEARYIESVPSSPASRFRVQSKHARVRQRPCVRLRPPASQLQIVRQPRLIHQPIDRSTQDIGKTTNYIITS